MEEAGANAPGSAGVSIARHARSAADVRGGREAARSARRGRARRRVSSVPRWPRNPRRNPREAGGVSESTNLVTAQLVDERRARDAEGARGLRLVAAVQAQRGQQ